MQYVHDEAKDGLTVCRGGLGNVGEGLTSTCTFTGNHGSVHYAKTECGHRQLTTVLRLDGGLALVLSHAAEIVSGMHREKLTKRPSSFLRSLVYSTVAASVGDWSQQGRTCYLYHLDSVSA